MSATNIVQELLEIMTPSSEMGSDDEWQLTLRFASEYDKEDLAEVIFATADPATEPWKIGSLIDHLIWNISAESVERLMHTLESWLCGQDRRKVSYALAPTYVFPFKTHEQMTDVLREVKARWPEFAPRCDQLVDYRMQRFDK